MRQQMKPLQLGINYGMGVRSLAKGLGRHPLIASEIIERHRRRYPRFWQWRTEMVQDAMLERKIVSATTGWPLRTGDQRMPPQTLCQRSHPHAVVDAQL